ncbi:MAG: SDR family oxidoreductase, partial [Nitrososphaerota archaeon]|nr:SDR family oxidoreductase [Nitrososphaerota archaeon]
DLIFLVSKYAVPHLLKNERSAMVNVSSDLGIQPIPGVDAYAASKGAIIALTKAMSKNWAKNGLRVNCVAPGPIDTPLLRRFVDEPILDFVKQTMIPMGRLGRTDEIASVIAYLAGDESSFVNGAIFTANGGLVG